MTFKETSWLIAVASMVALGIYGKSKERNTNSINALPTRPDIDEAIMLATYVDNEESAYRQKEYAINNLRKKRRII